MFFWSVPDGDRPYRDAYQQHVTRLLHAIGTERIARLGAPLRVKYRLTLAGRTGALVAVQRLHGTVRQWRTRRQPTPVLRPAAPATV